MASSNHYNEKAVTAKLKLEQYYKGLKLEIEERHERLFIYHFHFFFLKKTSGF